MEGIDETDFKALPSFIRALLEKEESYVEQNKSRDSEETSFNAENFILNQISLRKCENLPEIDKDKPSTFKESCVNEEKFFMFRKNVNNQNFYRYNDINVNNENLHIIGKKKSSHFEETSNIIDKNFKKNDNVPIFFGESKNVPHYEKDKSSDSEETSLNPENIFIFKNNDSNRITFPEFENFPPIGKDKPGTSTGTFLNTDNLGICKKNAKNVIFSHELEYTNHAEKNQQRNPEETTSAEENSNIEKVASEYKSFICFTYYDKNEIIRNKPPKKSIFFWRKETEEPPYCVIEEKYIGYPPRNQDDLKKLLEFSDSHHKSKSERLIYEPRRPRVRKSVKKKWSRKEYLKIRSDILEKITFFHSTGVIVWVPMVNCKIELVQSLVQKFGDIIMLHDRWIRYEGKEDSWGGVLVVYATPEETERAKTEIPERHGFMKTLRLSDLIDCLVSAEIEHYEKEKSEIFVSVPGKINNESMCQLETLLQTFGQVIPEDSYQVIGANSVRITTAYSCATYAFLALTVLDGLPFGESNVKKVEVTKTEREKAILDDFNFHLQDYIGSAAFSFS